MVTRTVTLLVLAALAAGCGGRSALPPAEVLVEDRSISSLTVDGDDLYWTSPAGGVANFSGRVMRLDRGGAAIPEMLADNQFNPHGVVVGRRGLYWGNQGDIATCGTMMMLGADGKPRVIEEACNPWALAAMDGTVTFHRLVETTSGLVELDEDTGRLTTRAVLDGYLGAVVSTPAAFYMLVHDHRGGYLARLRAGEDWVGRYNATGIRFGTGLTAADGYLYWSDRNYVGLPVQVFRTLANRTGGPELVAELEPGLAVWQLTHVDGALWLRAVSGGDDDRTGWLLRVDPDDGSVDRFEVDYLPYTLVPDGDRLLVVTEARRQADGTWIPSRVVSQPLH